MATHPDLIKFYDSSGQEIAVPREVYKQKILPQQFQAAINNADQLYGVIVLSLQDGFFQECIVPAQHLLQIDRNRERATVVLAFAHMQSGNLDAASDLLTAYLNDIGPSGSILTNLAQVYSARGDASQAEQLLWSALTTEPNLDKALEWWMAIHFQRGGESARSAALWRVAEIPGSWRAQLWLAQVALEQGNKDSALRLYRSIIASVREHSDALIMISGDLGKHGFAREAIEIVAPIYQPTKHGPMPGLNLIQAHLEINDVGQGKKMLSELERLNRHDIKPYLDNRRQRLR